MVPYADQANETGQQFNWQINVIKSKELNAWQCQAVKWHSTQV